MREPRRLARIAGGAPFLSITGPLLLVHATGKTGRGYCDRALAGGRISHLVLHRASISETADYETGARRHLAMPFAVSEAEQQLGRTFGRFEAVFASGRPAGQMDVYPLRMAAGRGSARQRGLRGERGRLPARAGPRICARLRYDAPPRWPRSPCRSPPTLLTARAGRVPHRQDRAGHGAPAARGRHDAGRLPRRTAPPGRSRESGRIWWSARCVARPSEPRPESARMR